MHQMKEITGTKNVTAHHLQYVHVRQFSESRYKNKSVETRKGGTIY